MDAPVTIDHIRTHGVITLIVYCLGKFRRQQNAFNDDGRRIGSLVEI
jgi:hypothetical protein